MKIMDKKFRYNNINKKIFARAVNKKNIWINLIYYLNSYHVNCQ